MPALVLKLLSLISFLPVALRHRFWIYLARIGRNRWGPYQNIQRMPFGTMLKTGSHVRMQEADVMRYVYHHTTISIPYMVDAYIYNGSTYLVEEHMNGKELGDCYREMDDASRLVLARNLHAFLQELRALPAPDGSICSYGGGPLYDVRISLGLRPFGPFASVAKFHDAFLQKSQLDIPEDVRKTAQRRILAAHMKEHKIVLTHNDLHPDNILVDEADHTKIVAILDWEATGWLPEYWEYIKSLSVLRFRKGKWRQIMSAALPGYDLELEADNVILKYRQDYS